MQIQIKRTIDVDGKTPLYMPGTMADAYRAMGGEVMLYGKPGVAFLLQLLARRGRRRGQALMVGDSLAPRRALGAAAAGLDSLFVAETGVHALRPRRGERAMCCEPRRRGGRPRADVCDA